MQNIAIERTGYESYLGCNSKIRNFQQIILSLSKSTCQNMYVYKKWLGEREQRKINFIILTTEKDP